MVALYPREVGITVFGRAIERLEVVNGGATSSDEELRELFEPLKRGSTQPTLGRHDDGLGLGLFIVREIAKAHGGTVTARTEGASTVFTVILPRTHARPDAAVSLAAI